MHKVLPNRMQEEVRRSARFSPFVLSEILYPPGFQIAWHSHELAAFALTLNGSSTEGFTKDRFERTERGVLVRPAAEKHWDNFGPRGAKCFLIEIEKAGIEDLEQSGCVLASPSFHQAAALAHLAERAYSEWLQNDSASPIAIRALALEMVAHLIRAGERRTGPRPPAWLGRVKQRLDDDFVDAPSLTELAGMADVHVTHLARQFRHFYRASIGEYVRQRRVSAAAEMLADTDQSLTEIALATGFAHHAHFCDVFKRLIGLTPSDFRRLRRPGYKAVESHPGYICGH